MNEHQGVLRRIRDAWDCGSILGAASGSRRLGSGDTRVRRRRHSTYSAPFHGRSPWLAIAASIALVATLLGAPPATGQTEAPRLFLTPQAGPSGAHVTASGDGFTGACGVRLLWAPDVPDLTGFIVLGDTPVRADGTFKTTFVVPDDETGPYLVGAIGAHIDGNGRCAKFSSEYPSQHGFTLKPTPPPPTADLVLSSTTIKQGGGVILDASGSTGGALYRFDLNGNGSFETTCRTPAAVLIIKEEGTKTVGVQVVGTDFQVATVLANVTVGGGTAPPPPKPGGGTYSPYTAGTKVGNCVEAGTDVLTAKIKAYECPTSVTVGAAEALIPPDLLGGGACFERKDPGTTNAHFHAQSRDVLVNGLRMHTVDPARRLEIYEVAKLVKVEGTGGQAKFSVVDPEHSTVVASGSFVPHWNVATTGVVGTVPLAQLIGMGRFLGLPYAAKDTPLTLIEPGTVAAGGTAKLQLYLQLPLPVVWFESLATTKALTLRVDSDGVLTSDTGYTLGLNDIYAGLFTLRSVHVSYQRDGNSDVWSGGFDLVFPESGVTADGSVVVRNGVLESLAAAINPGPPGLGPIGCCVWVVGFDGTLTNDYIQVGATFAAGPQVVGSARAGDAHGSATIFYDPFEFQMTVDDVHVVTIPVNVKGQVSVTLGSFSFTGGIDEDFGPFSFSGNVSMNVDGSSWFGGGGGDGCIHVVFSACLGVKFGAGPTGVAGCGSITIFPGTWFSNPVKLSGGALVHWPLADLDVDVFKGCGIGKIQTKVGAATSDRPIAGRGTGRDSVSFDVLSGLPVGLFAITGAGGHPHVRLLGPEGVDVTSPASADETGQGPGYFTTTLTPDDTTYIAINHPPAGTWRVAVLPGSTLVTSVGLARGIPPRVVHGQVSGTGATRELQYRAATIPGVRVVFVERGTSDTPDVPGGTVEHVIGSTRGGKGTIRFRPLDAKVGTRHIDAVILSGGARYRVERVDDFDAPAFHRLPGPLVSLQREDTDLVVRWTPVPGAIGYRVVADLSSQPTRGFDRPPGDRLIRIGGVTKRTTGRIEVRAVSTAGFLGRAGSARLLRA
jgi:hypothetical protein